MSYPNKRFAQKKTLAVLNDNHVTLSDGALQALDLACKNAKGVAGWDFFPVLVKKALVIRELMLYWEERTTDTIEAVRFVEFEVEDISPFRDRPPSE